MCRRVIGRRPIPSRGALVFWGSLLSRMAPSPPTLLVNGGPVAERCPWLVGLSSVLRQKEEGENLIGGVEGFNAKESFSSCNKECLKENY